MPSLVSVRVNVSTEFATHRAHGAVVVTGSPDEEFQVALTRAVREQLNPEFDGHLVGVHWEDPDYPEWLIGVIPDGMTMAAVREYFGDVADQEPPTIGVSDGGFGGDGPIAYGIELVRSGVEIAGYVAATLAVQRALVRARYGRLRKLARDWNDSDYISSELREAVMAQPVWERGRFDRTFGLDTVRGPLLLRTLGYSRRDYDWGQVWERSLDD